MAQIQINKWVADLFDNKSRFVFTRGGAGSGKSYGIAQKILIRITTEKGHRILCLRKVDKTLRSSVYQSCFWI
jgi:phage terminase large subunit